MSVRPEEQVQSSHFHLAEPLAGSGVTDARAFVLGSSLAGRARSALRMLLQAALWLAYQAGLRVPRPELQGPLQALRQEVQALHKQLQGDGSVRC